jgi:hypothetical protein
MVPFGHAQVRRSGTLTGVDHDPLRREDVGVEKYSVKDSTG